ncbi:MAG: sulfur carrier protein ThiS [Bacillota bacterium]|nr:sulfur carrier protein ThiS [Bacillota bacterium]
MIKLNNDPYPYHEGMTIASLMEEKKFTFRNIVVRLNDVPIAKEKWDTTTIADGDVVLMAHLFGGG